MELENYENMELDNSEYCIHNRLPVNSIFPYFQQNTYQKEKLENHSETTESKAYVLFLDTCRWFAPILSGIEISSMGTCTRIDSTYHAEIFFPILIVKLPIILRSCNSGYDILQRLFFFLIFAQSLSWSILTKNTFFWKKKFFQRGKKKFFQRV